MRFSNVRFLCRSPHPYFSRKPTVEADSEGKPKLFWDGFQWVTRTPASVTDPKPAAKGENSQSNVTGKDLRRVVITNIPLEFGLLEEDVEAFLKQKVEELDEANKDIFEIKSLKLYPNQNSVTVECKEQAMSEKLQELDGKPDS